MVGDKVFQDRAKALLKAEIKRRGLTYKDVAERLTASGTFEAEANIANKISRGGFSAAYFLQCLDAIGCKTLAITID